MFPWELTVVMGWDYIVLLLIARHTRGLSVVKKKCGKLLSSGGKLMLLTEMALTER